jgi:hypothetical protein
VPHAASLDPSRHWSPLQQPAQFDALHGPLVWQTFPMHAAPVPHGMQARPPAPHALLSAPETHVSVSSQHPTHVNGPHDAACSQIPSTHALPLAQIAHVAPSVPQALPAVPVSQRPLPSQHPKQLSALHALVVHRPPPAVPGSATHCSPDAAHVTHASPELPHAVGEVPVRHPPALQQPAHVVAPQPGASQRPPPNGSNAHDCPLVAQFEHVLPPVPHAESAVPGTHVPFSQQPRQPGAQAVVTHCWRFGSHDIWTCWQLMHALPKLPQSDVTFPGWHVPVSSQQPSGHVPSLQTPSSATGATHARVVGSHTGAEVPRQLVQAAPPPPQNAATVPRTHCPWEQQPVGHVVALHNVAPSMPPASSLSSRSKSEERPQPAVAKARTAAASTTSRARKSRTAIGDTG